MSIHASAVISPSAQVGTDVTIGPYAIIEDDVVIGDRCRIDAAAQVLKGGRIGADCRIGSGALISADPHFRGFDTSILSGAILGAGNVIRDYVTVHRSIEEGGNTVLGEGNFLMNGAHVGHDCVIGNENTLANNVLLGGHVLMGDFCFLGGATVVHQFVKIGNYVLTQGMAGTSLDLPHYVIAAGINNVAGINSIGLRRNGMSLEARKQIKAAFREVYHRTLPLSEVLENAKKITHDPHTAAFYEFFHQESKKGVCSRFRGSSSSNE